MRYVLIAVAALVAIAVLYLLFWPTRIDPVAVTVGPNPGFTGAFAPNDALRNVRWLGEATGTGPEDIWVKDGYAYTGLEDGRIVRVRIDGQTASGPAPLPYPGSPPTNVSPGTIETIVNTGGRPLGLQHDPYGNIVVADAKKGLLAITPSKQVIVVADKFEGKQLKFVDDLDIAKDGTIYFSDASQHFGIEEFTLDFVEGQATGRLFSFDPRTGTISKLLDNLAFANGVALGPDEEYVLVNETAAHRITRYGLKGARQGVKDTFVENLPGYPDNISFNGRNVFWVAMTGPRNRALEDVMGSPFRRRVGYRLQMIGLAPPLKADPYGIVAAINTDRTVVGTLQDPGGQKIQSITSVNERDGILYFGSIMTDRIAYMAAPPQLAGPPR